MEKTNEMLNPKIVITKAEDGEIDLTMEGSLLDLSSMLVQGLAQGVSAVYGALDEGSRATLRAVIAEIFSAASPVWNVNESEGE